MGVDEVAGHRAHQLEARGGDAFNLSALFWFKAFVYILKSI